MPRVRNGKFNAPCAAVRLAPRAVCIAPRIGLRLALCVSLVLAAGACAASRDPDPTRPRANEPPYPVILASNAERRDQALAGWAALARDNNVPNEPPPELQPVTATISGLPAADASSLRLPLVEIRDEDGGLRANSEEESRRESLRRFITGASALLGVAPQNLSLVARTDEANGTRRARYQQQPFPYPLRAGFGVLDIAFTDDRRVLSLSSTAITDTERLARALALVRAQQLTADQAVERVRGRSFTIPGADAAPQTYTVTPGDTVTPRELVVYPIRPAGDASALELRVAWELIVTREATPYLVYLDAVRGEIIAAQIQPAPSEVKPAGQQLPSR